MAQSYSFDVVSKINMEEVLNAITQSTREMSQRFDFKGSKSTIELNQKDREITVVGDDDMKLKNVMEILRLRMAKRDVPLKGLEYGKVEPTFSGTVTQKIKVQSGLTKDQCKEVTKIIKGIGGKVKSTIQDGQVRVSSAKKDDLQTVMSTLREKDLEYHLEFDNYR